MLVVVSLEGGIDGFHTQVEANDEIVEVQAQSQTVTDSQIFQDALKLKLSPGLIRIVAERPDITRIDKQRTAELPEQMGPVFEVQVEFQVTGLRDEVDVTVLVAVAPRAEAPDAPSAHAVGTAGEIALLEGQYGAVAVGIGDAEA